MNHWINKIAPTLVVLAVLGYCSWPSDEGPPAQDSAKSNAKDDAKGKKREISQAALNPTATSMPARDPFDGWAKNAPTPKKAAKSTSPVAPMTAGKGDGKNGPALAQDTSKQVASLALKATFLCGERRLALINDLFYAEGEALRSSTAKTPWLVAEVFPQHVVLEHQGQRVELKYPEREGTGAASATKAGRRTAKPDAPRK